MKINPNFDKKIKNQLAKIKRKSDEELNYRSHDCLLNRKFGQSKGKEGSTSKSLSEAMISEREYLQLEEEVKRSVQIGGNQCLQSFNSFGENSN